VLLLVVAPLLQGTAGMEVAVVVVVGRMQMDSSNSSKQ
jgi:hypothetical protein